MEISHDGYLLPVFRANSIFQVNRWKVFLLGHSKYGSKESWKPEKPIRGLPEKLSDTVRREAEATGAGTATYYTLDELEDIDLDEELGTPDLKSLKKSSDKGNTRFRRGIDFSIITPEGDEIDRFPVSEVPAEKKHEAAEKGETEIEVFRRDGLFRYTRENLVRDSERMSRGETPEPERIEATLKADVHKKRSYATDFQAFLELTEKIRKHEEFVGRRNLEVPEEELIPREDYRLVIWTTH